MIIRVHAVPNAKKAKVTRTGADSFDVRIDAHAHSGKANERLVEIMAEYLGVKKGKIAISKGARARDKILVIESEP